jgi:probable HAF family extracellular repeat protein
MKHKTWNYALALFLFSTFTMAIGILAQDTSPQGKVTLHHQYKVVDLGTFGGPGSFAYQQHTLSPEGAVVGGADTTEINPYPGCFNPIVGTECYVQHAFEWRNGILTDLGTLPGGSSSFPNGINLSGWVIGGSENGAIDPVLGAPEYDAVLWRNGQITNLGTLGGNGSLAYDVNDNGQIVGFAANAIPDPLSMGGFATQTRPFVWENGVMRDLGTFGGPDGMAFLTNQRGQTIGQYYLNSAVNPTTGTPTMDPILWETNGKAVDLGTLGGTSGTTYWINNRGQVVGQSNLAGDLNAHAFLWQQGVLTDLGTLGGDNSTPYFNSDRGDVVGRGDVPGSQTHHGFLWSQGVMRDLGVIDGDACSTAYGANDLGQIVGDAGICFVGGRAWLWEQGGPMVDLNAVAVPGSGLHLQDAIVINNRSEILCTGLLPNGDKHSVLLIPCDANHPGECADNSLIEAASPSTVPRFSPVRPGSELSTIPGNQHVRFTQKHFQGLQDPNE